VRDEGAKTGALRRERRPLALRDQRAGEHRQARERTLRAQREVAREHRALREAAEHEPGAVRCDRVQQFEHRGARLGEAVGDLARSIERLTAHRGELDCLHVDPPPRTTAGVRGAHVERRRGEGEAHLARHVEDAGEGHEVRARRAEAVQEDDERTVAAAVAVGAAGEADLEARDRLFTHGGTFYADGARAPGCR
jgi:hypothetical protein